MKKITLLAKKTPHTEIGFIISIFQWMYNVLCSLNLFNFNIFRLILIHMHKNYMIVSTRGLW